MSKTVKQAKSDLKASGLTVMAWADDNNYPPRAVLSGHNKGNYGQSHKIAVALGIKVNTK
jgi:gp16 family phage-associated protein